MPKPSFVYISADPYRNLTLGVTKDPDVAAFRDEDMKGLSVKVVYLEEFPTFKKALERLKRLTKMNNQRRRKLICKTNPDWHDLAEPRLTITLPSSGEELPPGFASGVGARIPRPPILPLVAADAKAWPLKP